MNSRELHGPGCTCSECILGDSETIIDLTNAIFKDQVYALNEKNEGSCKKIFKTKDKMLDKTDYTESNDDDPELLIYIPFTSQCKIRTMTMIGGEDGTSPAKIKLYVNQDSPDFDLKDTKPSQEIDCIENPLGELPYNLTPSKFNNTWSITLIVTLNYQADNTKIYYIGFEGVSTNKRTKVILGNYELNPLPNTIQQRPETNKNTDLIYG